MGFPYSVHTYAGMPYFNGGCGISCFRSVFEACGYEWRQVGNGKNFSAYTIPANDDETPSRTESGRNGERMENKAKRKTHTSSAVKNRYNAKNYKNFRAAIKPDLYERIDEYLKQEGISRPEFLLRAIEKMKGEQQ